MKSHIPAPDLVRQKEYLSARREMVVGQDGAQNGTNCRNLCVPAVAERLSESVVGTAEPRAVSCILPMF
jgi:hypothetical protein